MDRWITDYSPRVRYPSCTRASGDVGPKPGSPLGPGLVSRGGCSKARLVGVPSTDCALVIAQAHTGTVTSVELADS